MFLNAIFVARNIPLFTADSIKTVSILESLLSDKHYAEYRVTIESAIRYIKSSEFVLGKGGEFVMMLAKQLYTEGFIHAFHEKISSEKST